MSRTASTCDIIQELERRVRERLADWPKEWQGYHWPGYTRQHTYRVRDLALDMGSRAACDAFVLESAALLHDIAKPTGADHAADGARETERILHELGVDGKTVSAISSAVETHVGLAREQHPIENRILADADYIDANFGLIAVWRYITIRGHRRDPFETQICEMKSWLEKRRPAVEQLGTEIGREIGAARYARMTRFCRAFDEEFSASQVRANRYLWEVFTRNAQNAEPPDVRVSIAEIESGSGLAADAACRAFVCEIVSEIDGKL